MLTMRPRFAMVLVWFRPVGPRHSPRAVFLMNRDEVPKSPRFFSNYYSTTTIHADVSTVLLQIIPMHHDLIKRGES